LRMDGPRRLTPGVEALSQTPHAQALAAAFGTRRVAAAIREVLREERAQLHGGAAATSAARLIEAVADQLGATEAPRLRPVINATGIVIHTNLGRAPLAMSAARAADIAGGYGNLELDLENGRRASRHGHVEGLIAELTGTEAGFAVNNGAAGVLLALTALAQGAPVAVSRGELIEIGGGFRVPDIVAQGGEELVEVGTTNRTHLRDYAEALARRPTARIILRTHTSNFRIEGFASKPPLGDLARFAREKRLLLVEDLGGRALLDLKPYGITGEPIVKASIGAGVDLVVFSGDKLLGGPQAGVLAGRREAVAAARAHPLARAVRINKLSLAALATLGLLRPPNDPTRAVPVLRMLTEREAAVAARARRLVDLVGALPGVDMEIRATEAFAGGGAMPMRSLPSHALAVRPDGGGGEILARALRPGAPAVVGRIERDWLLVDMRTVGDEELPDLARALGGALG